MDLGATICSPKRPACALCPWNESCLAFARGDQETFPRKARKREGKLRRGAAFVVVRADGRVLLRSRPEKGLLGGMSEVPGSAWSHDFDVAQALRLAPRLKGAKWRRLAGTVRHVFTHFPLELTVFAAQVARATPGAEGRALGEDRRLAGRSLAQFDAQSAGARYADLNKQRRGTP